MRLLLRLWTIGWPRPVRRVAEWAVTRTWLQQIIFPTHLVGTAGIVQNDAGEYLLVRHSYRDRYPWGLPSGFLEHGEQPDAALVREIAEETGLHVDQIRLVGVYAEEERPLVSIILSGHCQGGQFVPSAEVTDCGFFRWEAFPPISPEQQRLLDVYRRESARETDDGVRPELL